jgi:hypothetical protein
MTAPMRKQTRRFLDTATERFRSELGALAAEHERAGIELRRLLGDPNEFATRAVHATVPHPTPWDELVGPFTRSGGVQRRLGISRQAVAAKAARRRLLRVVTEDGEHVYPLWQFDGVGTLAGLPEVLSLFPEDDVDGWTLAGWLCTEDAELGTSPREALVRGRVAAVQAVARTAAQALTA